MISRRGLLRGVVITGGAAAIVGMGGVGSLLEPSSRPTGSSRVVFLHTYFDDWVTQFGVGVVRDALQDLGYGRMRISYEVRRVMLDSSLSVRASEAAALNPDVIICDSPDAALALKAATNKVPVLFVALAVDPVQWGIVASLARPAGNLTGFSSDDANRPAKPLELLKECVPGIKRVAVVRDGSEPESALADMRRAAKVLGMEIVPLDLRAPAELEAALTASAGAGVDALLQTPAAMYLVGLYAGVRIAEFAVNRGWPTFLMRNVAGLLSYANSAYESDSWLRVATYTDRILRGTTPRELPVQVSSGSGFVVNLCTAAKMGLTVPQSVMAQANYVSRPPGDEFYRLCAVR